MILVRLRPLLVSAPLAVAKTAQDYAGMHIGLWLHLPRRVLIVAAVVLQFFWVWWTRLSWAPLKDSAF